VIVGIDIGGTRIKTAAVRRDGEILTAREVATPSSLEGMREVLRIAVTGLQSNSLTVEAVGLGCKGIIHPENTGVVTLPGTLHYLEGHRLSSLVAEHLPPGCPVFADVPTAHLWDLRSPHARYAILTQAGGKARVEMLALEYDWAEAAEKAMQSATALERGRLERGHRTALHGQGQRAPGGRPAARRSRGQIALRRHMQPYESGDPFAEERLYRFGREVGVTGVVARPEQLPDVVNQARHLEFLVGGMTAAQQRGGL